MVVDKRLIEAAPDLLIAAKEALQALDSIYSKLIPMLAQMVSPDFADEFPVHNNKSIVMLRDAIAKAEGE